jgi:hypothetical protein
MSTTAAIGRPYRRNGSRYVIEKSRGDSPESGHGSALLRRPLYPENGHSPPYSIISSAHAITLLLP